jgi:hypothetical protein
MPLVHSNDGLQVYSPFLGTSIGRIEVFIYNRPDTGITFQFARGAFTIKNTRDYIRIHSNSSYWKAALLGPAILWRWTWPLGSIAKLYPGQFQDVMCWSGEARTSFL